MDNPKKAVLLIVIATVVALAVGGAAIGILYRAAVEKERVRLSQTANSEARLIEMVWRSDENYDNPAAFNVSAADLQVKNTYGDHGLGESGEITVARREGDRMVFISRRGHSELAKPAPIPIQSNLAVAMRRAILGESGTLIAPDYQGVTVLAAYEPIAAPNIGVVAQIDIAEIRAPFFTSAVVAATAAVLLIAAGTAVFLSLTDATIQRLRRSEQQFRSIAQSAHNAIVSIRSTGQVVSWNAAAERIFGYQGSEILGQPLTRIIPDRYLDAHRTGLDRVNTGGEFRVIGKTIELAGQRKDGSEFPVEVSLSTWTVSNDRYFTGIIRDITERKLAEESLRKLSGVLEHSPVTVMITDPAGKIEYVNPKFTDVTGYTFDEAIGQNPRFLKSSYMSSEEYEQLWETITSGDVWRGELQNRKKTGETLCELASIAPVRDTMGRVTHFVAIKEDITERKRTEEQLRHAQKMEVIGELTGGVAHDFNNLLGIILGNLDLLDEEIPQKASMHEFVVDAIGAAERGADLTNRLLAFARRQTLAPKPTDLNKLIRGTMKLLGRTLGARVEIHEVLAPGLWKTMADPGALENAFTNLVVNARDAMPNGGSITIGTGNFNHEQEITDQQTELRPGNYVCLSVSDTGTGMPPEVSERIFEPFFTTKDVGKGTGLGLSMVYGFVKQSGGHVTVDSEVGRGTMVTLYLPRVTRSGKAMSKAPRLAAYPADKRGVVLVVEDEAKMRKIAMRALGKAGYTVIKAAHATKALQRIEGLPRLDLLFTDIILPGALNGIELAREVQQLRPEAKVLYTSGYAKNEIIPSDEGAEFLPKPYRRKDLIRKVQAVLNEAREGSVPDELI